MEKDGRNKTAGVNDASLSHFFFFHHFYNFFIFSLSSSLFPPRRSFLLVAPSSSSLFLPRPALSKSLRIHKRPFFIDFDESVTDGRTDQPTNQRTDKASYRDARTHLKIPTPIKWSYAERAIEFLSPFGRGVLKLEAPGPKSRLYLNLVEMGDLPYLPLPVF